ncbi:MAG: hypothetical protein SNH80_02525 [Rikenellaceae bacterium]
MVDGKTLHGGLSDRVRGIIFGYLASKDAGVDFKVHFSSPFKLESYLEPNTHDWIINESDISYNSNEAEPIYIHSAFDKQYESKLKFDYLKKRIAESSKSQVHLYSNIIYTKDGRYSSAFKELFKPTAIVQKELDRLHSILGDSYLTATFRFQNSLGDFAELNLQPLSPDKQQDLISRCRQELEKLHHSYADKSILVTSDSKKFLEAVDSLDYVYTIKGELVHMSFTADSSLDLHKKPFVDYMMIAGAEQIFLFCTSGMYQSGFPYTASLINNRPFKEIRF